MLKRTGSMRQLSPHFAGKTSSERALLAEDMHVFGTTILLPEHIGSTIDAHGIAKGTLQQQIDTLEHILQNGVDTQRDFHTAPLAVNNADKAGIGAGIGTGGGEAFRNGAFILISKPGQRLKTDGIDAVLVNPAIEELIPDLKAAYPDTNFVAYDKLNDHLLAQGTITKEEHQTYSQQVNQIKAAIITAACATPATGEAPLPGEQLPPPPVEIIIQ
ncbi:MAG: hypothetical protein KDI13_11295 [Alphaproteobacteria bacterium]|nr:hypothetical protein [Alphaproteobacteria bacterium]